MAHIKQSLVGQCQRTARHYKRRHGFAFAFLRKEFVMRKKYLNAMILDVF